MTEKTLGEGYGLKTPDFWDAFITPSRWEKWRGTAAWLEIRGTEVIWHWESDDWELRTVGYAFVLINHRPTTIRVKTTCGTVNVAEIEQVLAAAKCRVYAMEMAL